MDIRKFLKQYWFQFVAFVLLALPLLFVGQENIAKALIILVSLLAWLIVSIKTKSVVLSSVLYTLITLPLNLTYQLPTHVLFFNTDPYVSGIYTNYLVPTISILDLGLVLLIASYIYEYGWKHIQAILHKYLMYLIPFGLFVLLQSVFRLDLNSLINGGRLVLGIISLLFLIDYFKAQKHFNLYKYVLWISIASILAQGVLGAIQFLHGSSLGLSMLGESQVVSGMQGSSFVTLNSEVFLRAYGTFPHPNVLGGYFVMSVLLGIFLYSKSNGFYKKLSILLIILSGIFVTLTFSRISILLVLGIVFVTLIYKLIKGKLFSFAPLLLVERFTNLISGNDTSWTDRVNLVKSSLSVIKNNLFFGTGLGNFTKGMENYIPNTVNGVLLIQPVHNVLLLMIAELGIVGSLLYVLLLGKVLVSNISKMNWFKWLVVLVLIVIGCFDHYLFSLPQGMVIGGILLLLLMSYKKCMQVYISGAHNTGKTYLIESLRESGSLPIVDEGVSEIMLSHGWTVRDLKKNKEVFMELQKEVLTSKIKQTFAEDSFLIDRSIFDPLVYAKTYLGEEGFISLLRYGESVGLKKSIQIMKRRILIVLSPEFELARIEANTPNSIKFSSGVSNEKKVFEDMCHYHRNLVDLLEQWHIPYHLISVLDIEERKLKLQGIIDRNVI